MIACLNPILNWIGETGQAFERSARWAFVGFGPFYQGRWPWLLERLAPWAEIAFERCDDVAFDYWAVISFVNWEGIAFVKVVPLSQWDE